MTAKDDRQEIAARGSQEQEAIRQNRLPDEEPEAPDPFDVESLRLSPNYSDSIGVRRAITTIPCRKPNRQAFVRVRAGADWQVDTAIYVDEGEREAYLVAQDLWPELMDEISPTRLRLAITRQGNLFLWPLKLPKADGRSNPWHESAIAAATLAEKRWIRMAADMPGGLYQVYEANGNLPEPEWPEVTFQEVIKLCFKNRRIAGRDHPILKSLWGES